MGGREPVGVLALLAAWLVSGLTGVSAAYREALASMPAPAAGHSRVWLVGASVLTLWLARGSRRPCAGGLLALHGAWACAGPSSWGARASPRSAPPSRLHLTVTPDSLLGIVGTAGLFPRHLHRPDQPHAAGMNRPGPRSLTMKISKRRQVLAAGGLAAFGVGFSETPAAWSASSWAATRRSTRRPATRPRRNTAWTPGQCRGQRRQQVSYTTCLGCTTMCGVRVRTDRATGKVLRVAGNPYSPLSTDPHLPMKASVRESFAAISAFEGKGLAGRSTACGRGNAVAQQIDSPFGC